MITNSQSKAKIEIDGGVNLDNASELKIKGADVLVAGNAVFKSDSPIKTISMLNKS
jgi:ribulose-phosphate 3-epimerase